MTKEHDYEAALEDLLSCYQWDTQDRIGLRKPIRGDTYRAVQSALKLAARMKRGEKIKTADELLLEMELLIETTTDTPYHPQKNGFKAYAFLLENINRIYSALKIVEQHEEDKTND